jgi:hypothetical protein
MTQIDHDRCSELLLAYERGELAAADAYAVEQHLRSCSRCADERSGVATLIHGEIEPLTPTERARVHAAVAEELRRRAPVPTRRLRTPLWRRISGWQGGALVGAAAAVLLIVGALVVGPRVGGGEEVADTAATGGAEPGTDATRGPEPVFAAPVLAAEALPDVERQEAQAAQGEAATPAQQQFQLGSARTLASTARPFERFAAAFQAEDVIALRDVYVDELARQAATKLQGLPLRGPPAEVLRSCAELAMRESANPLLPAYATYAPVDGVNSLVIGFVYSDDGSGRVDRYTIMAWPEADCDAPPVLASGTIER